MAAPGSPVRCSDSSLVAGEAVAGSASTWSACLLVEDEGPWGPKVLTESRLSPALREKLAALPLRVLLVRRHGRTQAASRPTVMASWTTADEAWLEQTSVAHLDDLLDLDLTPLLDGGSLGWDRASEPLFLVCTHGRRDVCCAERGRPVAAALSSRFPTQTWECSHVGGHRFAANLVVLPQGLAYGRVEPTGAADLAQRWLDGTIDPALLRGWVHQEDAEQVTEATVRQRLGLDGVEEVRVRRADRADTTGAAPADVPVLVDVATGPYAGRHQVSARPVGGVDDVGASARVLASCGDETSAPVVAWEVGPLRPR